MRLIREMAVIVPADSPSADGVCGGSQGREFPSPETRGAALVALALLFSVAILVKGGSRDGSRTTDDRAGGVARPLGIMGSTDFRSRSRRMVACRRRSNGGVNSSRTCVGQCAWSGQEMIVIPKPLCSSNPFPIPWSRSQASCQSIVKNSPLRTAGRQLRRLLQAAFVAPEGGRVAGRGRIHFCRSVRIHQLRQAPRSVRLVLAVGQ